MYEEPGSALDEPGEISGFTASIIIPAFNEEDRIFPLLTMLDRLAVLRRYRVIVSCNGSSDRTADIARSFENIDVLESPIAAKSGAIRAAEALADDVFPRLYMDADVDIDPDSVDELIRVLNVSDSPVAVRPEELYDLEDSPWLVRSFYSTRKVIPSTRRWMMDHIEGRGIYGTNRAGRSRFGEFPDVRADDAFFDRMFDSNEKLAVPSARVVLRPPSDARALIRSLTRVSDANEELDDWLRAHRPDRIENLGVQHQRMSAIQQIRYWLHGGSTFPSWKPSTVVPITGALLVRRLAKLNVWFHRRSDRTPDWR